MHRARALVLLLAVAACRSQGGAGGALTGRTFLSNRVTEGGADRSLVAGTRILIGFDDGTLTASAGCNTFGGSVTVTGDRLLVDELGSTEMGCEAALADQDQWLGALLAGDPGYTLDSDALRLVAGDVTVDLTDRRAADPDRPLSGTTWRLDGIVDGEVASSAPAGAPTMLRLDDGIVTVDIAGCDHGEAAAEVDGDGVRFGALSLTGAPCDEAGETVRAAIRAALSGSATATVEADALTLVAEDGSGLMLRAAP